MDKSLLIVVDDFSKDTTYQIAKKLSSIDHRIRVFTNAFPKGAAGARNTAILNSKGRFISFLDSDDLWGVNTLNAQYEAFSQGRFLIHSSIELFGDSLSTPVFIDVPARVNYKMMMVGNFMPNLTVSYDTSFFGKVYAPYVQSRNDYALWLRLFLQRQCHSYSYKYTGTRYRVDSSFSLSKASIAVNIYRYISVVSRSGNHFVSYLCLPAYLLILFTKKTSPRIYNKFVVRLLPCLFGC